MPLLIGWAPTPPAAQPRPFSAGAPPRPQARSRISPGREGQSGSSWDSSLGPGPAIQIRKLRLIRRERQFVFGLTAL